MMYTEGRQRQTEKDDQMYKTLACSLQQLQHQKAPSKNLEDPRFPD